MHTFEDNAGRTWSVAINVSAIKRVRGLAGVDLLSLVDDGSAGLARLLGDPVSLVDVLYALCKEEADRGGVSDEAFGAAMYGDAIEAAADAFLGEFTDFFPDPRVRAGLKRLIAAGRTVRDRMVTEAIGRLDEIDVESEVSRSIASSGASPGSSGSIPAP